jgi:hypothetical protein
MVPRLDDENPSPSNDWQRGVHLCSSCQWHCAMLAQENKTYNIVQSELRNIEHSLFGECLPFNEDIYFDTIRPSEALKKLEGLDNKYKNEVILDAIKSLHQILDVVGFDKLRIVV